MGHALTTDLEQAVLQLRRGRPVILLDSLDREGEGDLAFAAQFCTPELVNLCLSFARGLLCVALSPSRAERLGISRLPSNHRDRFATPFGLPISLADDSSGISTTARAATIRATSDPEIEAAAFSYPGHVCTLIANPLGLRQRRGHTEAILDLLTLAGIDGSGVLCEILTESGAIASPPELGRLARQLEAPLVAIDSIVRHLERHA